MQLKGSNTEKNILAAFGEEAGACCRYSIFAQQAREEGNEEIAVLFEKMEQEEKGHARAWYKLFHGGFGSSRENLHKAAHSENEEWKKSYPLYAQQAREEGFEELAVMFERIASIEYAHERRFLEEVLKLENGEEQPSAQSQEEQAAFYCLFCGHMEKEKPLICPVCKAENSFSD